MATVNFLYRSTKSEAPINLRLLFRHNSTDYVLGCKTKFTVSKQYWSKQHTQSKPKDIVIANKQVEVKTELNKIENHILNVFNSVNPDEVNKDWLQTQIDNYYNPPKTDAKIPVNLIDYIDYYIDYRKNELKQTSIEKYNVIKSKLQRFEVYLKKQILIKEINDSFKNEFENYLKLESYAKNTIQRDFTFIKTFCKHARFKGLETHIELDSLRIDRDNKVEKIYLTFDELTKIENIDKSLLFDYLDNAKDWLIISCYTGQRVSDFMRFTPEMIRYENGKPLLEFTQKKTDKLMTVPLHPKVIEILNKRNGNFPRPISDQKYNEYIKTVCELADIKEPTNGSQIKETKKGSKKYRKVKGTFPKYKLVSSHIGRRSFASNFYGKIPTTYLIYVTGHSTEAMFLNYIGKSNKDLALEITNYF